ncbi:hypothetical protein B0H11DRAFT_2140501 [Mycena galericulata]|nr:hypothetical protein B0H11DRAFT_2140501 [Mycena galericulata]
MPETREGIASGMQAQEAFEMAKAAGHTFTLEGMAAEATKAEAKLFGASQEAKDGLVYNLDATSTVKRGQNHHQAPLFPPSLRVSPQNPYPPALNTLVLEKITYTNRALILHFGTLFFMLQYLTHTSVQFYPREDWEMSIRNVDKTVRKFSVGLAFIFSSHVVGFPSIDLVFQPTWATSLSDFSIPPNIFTSTLDYLALVADWIEGILLEPSHTRACDKIRASNTIFYGIGVYTVMELFFMAGLSPFLTLYEVFSNPSRTARFLTAFYSYIARSERDLWSTLLQPCIHNGVLAPTTEQRLRYADWLYVWAKDRTSMPLRMANLVDEFNVQLTDLESLDGFWGRDSRPKLFDVFEPSFVAAGLQLEHNLGHLIFGEDVWIALGGKRCLIDDPITALYRKHNLLSSPTMLKHTIYTPLFLSTRDVRGKTASHRPTYAFRGQKEMWSITRDFPTNSHWSSDPKIQMKKIRSKAAEVISGANREALFIKNIITKSLGVSIGPLEYCGVGHIVYIGAASYVAVCKGDPAIPKLHEMRTLRGLDRISSHLDAPGKRKRARSEKENKQLIKKLSKIEIGYQRAGTYQEAVVDEDQPTKPKKRRLSADQKLALDTLN